jgi:PEP-CTERM motif-containing protein
VGKLFALAGIFSVAAVLPAVPSAANILDGSFEVQAPAEIGANPGYCYGPGPTCTGVNTPWESFDGGGFQLETNVAWPGTPTPAGDYYAFIQNGGSVNQAFTAAATGTFVIEFLEAGRNNPNFSGNQLYEVLLNGSPIFSGSTVSGQPFTAVTTDPFELILGQNYSLSFHGLTFEGDQTAYIDDVRLTAAAAIPEPSTWALLLLGFGAVGLAMRRRGIGSASPRLA